MKLLSHPRFVQATGLHGEGRFEEAGRIYQELIEEHSDDPDLWHFKGLLALHRGHADEAVRCITLAIVLKPGTPDYFQNLGLAYETLGNAEKAAETYNKLGNAFQEQCRFADAIPAYQAALALRPRFPAAWVNRGAALDRLGRYAEAAQAFDNALTQLPGDDPATLLNRANAQSGLGHAEQAIETYARLLEAEPDNAAAHCSRALLLLRLGRMEEGWREYEWRWARQGGFREPRGQFRQPVWRGESPEQLDGTLLVIAEQGLGDIIQFARYVPLLAKAGYDVLFEVLPELTSLFAEGLTHEMNIRVIARIDNPVEVEGHLAFAAWVGVMSLPERFGTTLDTIPVTVPYLRVDAGKTARWRERIGSLRRQEAALKVGIAWAGNPKNLNDFARSIPAGLLGPLLEVAGVQFFSLQKGPTAEHDFGPVDIVRLGPELGDFTDTAAAILALDLVITVDTSVCHMAGALGCPAWLLIPQNPDWRWLNEGETSRWYPSLRVFRQSVRGEWPYVIERVAAELSRHAGAPAR